jgi:hypothetical protein
MKIDIAIHSSDINPFYFDFWKIVSRIWRTKFNVLPILVYIDENHDVEIDQTYGTVFKLKPIKGIEISLQCLWVRYWVTSQFPDKICILSDIDMLPISKKYFIDQIAGIDDDKYIHLNPAPGYLASCYHVAKGSNFKKVLDLDDSWETSITRLNSMKLGYTHAVEKNVFLGWGSDEIFATDRILNKYPVKEIFVFLSRSHERIDRSNWNYTVDEILNDKYADSHSIRPYSEHKDEIDKLVDIILRK